MGMHIGGPNNSFVNANRSLDATIGLDHSNDAKGISQAKNSLMSVVPGRKEAIVTAAYQKVLDSGAKPDFSVSDKILNGAPWHSRIPPPDKERITKALNEMVYPTTIKSLSP